MQVMFLDLSASLSLCSRDTVQHINSVDVCSSVVV
jgi:hypothetical protein